MADFVGLTAAFVFTQALSEGGDRGDLPMLYETILFAATLPGWVVLAKVYGLYSGDEERADHSTPDDLVGVFHLVTVGVWLIFVVSHLADATEVWLPKLVGLWIAAIVFVTCARAAARTLGPRSPKRTPAPERARAPRSAPAPGRKPRAHASAVSRRPP